MRHDVVEDAAEIVVARMGIHRRPQLANLPIMLLQPPRILHVEGQRPCKFIKRRRWTRVLEPLETVVDLHLNPHVDSNAELKKRLLWFSRVGHRFRLMNGIGLPNLK